MIRILLGVTVNKQEVREEKRSSGCPPMMRMNIRVLSLLLLLLLLRDAARASELDDDDWRSSCEGILHEDKGAK